MTNSTSASTKLSTLRSILSNVEGLRVILSDDSTTLTIVLSKRSASKDD